MEDLLVKAQIVLGLVGGPVVLWFGLYILGMELRLLFRGVKATAQVTRVDSDVHEAGGHVSSIYDYHLNFTAADGRAISFVSAGNSREVRVGQFLTVRYDPNKPEQAQLTGRNHWWFIAALLLIGGGASANSIQLILHP